MLEGIENINRLHPDVDVFVAAIDETLSAEGMIVPGVGDAGDRMFGCDIDDEPNVLPEVPPSPLPKRARVDDAMGGAEVTEK